MSKSRTTKSLKNSAVALAVYIINLGLNFFSRKIFLDYLGEDVLGLNTTVQNLLQFLNLSELGISTAVGFSLYKPIKENDRISINEIITLQGQLYHRVALIIILGSIILMSCFPIIFAKIKLPLWYAYASFGVLLFSSLLGYFVNYKQVVLSASQQDYKIQYSFKAVQLLKICTQMLAIRYLTNGYIWWLVLEFAFAIISSLSLHVATMKAFPWLNRTNQSFKELRLKYRTFTIKIKQLFVHKIGCFALTQSSPIIIYAYTNLSIVALYGNYLIVITGVQQLIAAIFNSLTAGVGNLVAEGNKNKIWKVFDELFSVRFFISSVLCFVLYVNTGYFIDAWIGCKYLLSNSTLAIMVAILFINLTRYTVETFINAYGLYQDIYAAIIEAALNIGCSILLGYYFGLNGVLCGVLISLFFIVLFWKPYFLFTRGIKDKFRNYLYIYFKHLLLLSASCALSMLVLSYISVPFEGWQRFLMSSAFSTIIFGGIFLCLMLVFRCGIRLFVFRIKHLCK